MTGRSKIDLLAARRTPVGRRSTLGRFGADAAGNMGIMFAGCIVFTCAAIGLSLDVGRAIDARTKLQASLDSAVLAGGREFQISGSAGDAEGAADRYFAAAFGDAVPSVLIVNEVSVAASSIELEATAAVPATFMKILGVDAITIGAAATAMLDQAGSDKDLEVSMMLDITGSMAGSKIEDLKAAAKDLVNIVIQEDQSNRTTRVALVPFSEGVRPGTYLTAARGTPDTYLQFEDVSGNDRTWRLSNCVSERTGDNAFTDASPAAGGHVGAIYSSNGSCKPGNANSIMPLSTDVTALESKIDGFIAQGGTAGHLGTAWAWYTLSPNWNDVWSGDGDAAPYDPGMTLKVAVLMTDGEYNTQYYEGVKTTTIGVDSPNGSANAQAAALCEGMKDAGITVYTIGFELEDATAIDMLEDCATDPSHAFVASDGTELRLAFREIAFQLAQLRLTR